MLLGDALSSLTDASVHRNAAESSLLRLPPELRNRFYTYVVGGNDFDLTDGLDRRPRARLRHTYFEPDYHMLGLLRTCRQIHAETRLLPFTCNIFSYSNTLTAFNWRRAMPTQMLAIRCWKIIWTSSFSAGLPYYASMCPLRNQSFVILQLFYGVTKVEMFLRNDRFDEVYPRAEKGGVSLSSFHKAFPQMDFVYTHVE